MKHFTSIFLIMIFLTGCVTNPYTEYYKDTTQGKDYRHNPRYVPPTGEPMVIRGDAHASDQEALRQDIMSVMEQGYAQVGYASFTGKGLQEDLMLAKAKELGASAILIETHFKNTVTNTIPITTFHNNTSTTTYSGHVYGRNGGSYSGTATTTTPTTSTTYYKSQYDRYSMGVFFFAKIKVQTGMWIADVPNERRLELNTNQGQEVTGVVKESPAYYADIFRGDILMKVGDISIYSEKDYKEAVKKYAGDNVDMVFFRKGEEITKTVKIYKYD